MKIALILSQSSGGLPHYTAQLANALAEHTEAEVMVMKPTETTADGVFTDEVLVREVFRPLSLSLVEINRGNVPLLGTARGMLSYKNINQVREFDPDVVHIPVNLFPQVQAMTKLYRIDRDFPIVTTYHEVFPNELVPDRPLPGIVHHWLNMLLPSINEDQVVVHTDDAKEILVERGYDSDSVHVLEHAAYDFFEDNGSEVEYDDEGENTILFFGNIVEYKDLDLLVNATLRVQDEIDDLTCIIAGDGKISVSTMQKIEENPSLFELRNEFIPNDDVSTLFRRADLVVLPYASRDGKMGHSGVQTIAHTFGVPVLATDVGEFKETIEEQGAGRVVMEGDIPAFSSSISNLFTNRELLFQMGQASRQRAEGLSWEEFAKKHLMIYSKTA